MSFVSILKNNDRVIKGLYCIFFQRASKLLSTCPTTETFSVRAYNRSILSYRDGTTTRTAEVFRFKTHPLILRWSPDHLSQQWLTTLFGSCCAVVVIALCVYVWCWRVNTDWYSCYSSKILGRQPKRKHAYTNFSQTRVSIHKTPYYNCSPRGVFLPLELLLEYWF